MSDMSEVAVSKQYRHTVSELHKDRLENRITEQELSQRLDELNEEETKRQEHLGPLLIKQALENVEKAILEDQQKALEAKFQQEKFAQNQRKQKEQAEQRERAKKVWNEQKVKERKEQEEQRAREQERLSFREMTERNISERDTSAKKLQQQYNILQIILLIFSAITATMAGIDGVARGFVAFTGVIATIAGGLLTTFKLQDRIYANHKAAAELRLECQKYDYHIDEYKDIGPAEAFIKFSRAVNLIQGEQMLQEVELWNPKRDESKKAQPEIKANQPEEEESEKARDAEIAEELFAEDGESDEKQHEVVPSSSENASLR